ncbi:MAG: AAA family ATPase [Eggerthellaceae bacterium]|nr:AAA family ATPase [Eggerthellaceae bacterium]
MDALYELMQSQLESTPTDFLRYKYNQVNWDARMFGLVGPRGVGKTTLFLQRIKLAHGAHDALYVSADHMYFADHTLYEVAERFSKDGGTFLFIDEVHKHPGWSRELKAAYDAFPDVRIRFAGSSVLDIEKGEADLSRRAPRHLMQGLSFREFLAIRHGIDAPVLTLEQALGHAAAIPGVRHPLPLFREYLASGYYPFGDDRDFGIELNQVITRTLESDIPQYANMNAATGRKLKKLMAAVSELSPFKPNMTRLAGQIQASRNNVEDYLLYMEKAGMISQLRSSASALDDLDKVEKVYLDNPNILYNLGGQRVEVGTVRETFFMNQVRVGHDVRASARADFEVEGLTFEVGGRSKTQEQIGGLDGAYIAKDDIEHGHGNVVPLWAFGLLY